MGVDLEKGNSLADSMRGQGHIFPPVCISMVEAGEESGSLDIAFTRLATHFEKAAKLKATIKKATIYPVILIVVCVAVIIVMLTFVVPRFMSVFDQIDVDMPGITLAVIRMSNFMVKYWYIIVAAIVGAVLGVGVFRKTDFGRSFLDNTVLQMCIRDRI